MSNTESYPLLRDAYAIIDGIPKERFELSQWRQGGRSPNGCGTIACAAGWLAMHPEMQDRGLLPGTAGMPEFRNEHGHVSYRYDALALLFGISKIEATAIFSTRFTGGRFDPSGPEQLCDKELWKARVRNFLNQSK